MHTGERYSIYYMLSADCFIHYVLLLVDIDYNIGKSENPHTEVSIQITCTKLVPFSTNVNQVTIEVANQAHIERQLITCNGSSNDLKFSALESGTAYDITAIWTSENNSACKLGNFSTCKLSCMIIWKEY